MSEPKPSHKSPATKDGKIDLGYEPQGSGQEHDAFFASVVPGTAGSGNLGHKYGAEGDHSVAVEPPSDMESE